MLYFMLLALKPPPSHFILLLKCMLQYGIRALIAKALLGFHHDGAYSYSQSRGYIIGGKNHRQVCSYFGKLGHRVEVCYKKNGFPPNFAKYKGNAMSNSASHITIDNEKDDESTIEKKEAENGAWFPFTIKQCQALIALIKQPERHNDNTNQIISTLETCMTNQRQKMGNQTFGSHNGRSLDCSTPLFPMSISMTFSSKLKAYMRMVNYKSKGYIPSSPLKWPLAYKLTMSSSMRISKISTFGEQINMGVIHPRWPTNGSPREPS
ncbi:hypothetical protein VNO77_19573 [Canavalia gladiata]|uniref:Uncharacterized protein n=1 Tax=Canavalia gladiata TaxID=3824 RepID=A0AAN9LMY8_CANGL